MQVSQPGATSTPTVWWEDEFPEQIRENQSHTFRVPAKEEQNPAHVAIQLCH